MEAPTQAYDHTSAVESPAVTKMFDVLIVGGGTAGITVAAQLRRKKRSLNLGILEPSDTHYYQPAWTLVGGGAYEREDTARPEADVIPEGATWIREYADIINPDECWVDTDPQTLQHRVYENVFSLGDASNLPTAKTGAAVRKEAPVLIHNLLQKRRTNRIESPEVYDGYSSCPLVTGYGKLVLAEFDYDNNPAPSLPIDTTKERRGMYLLKKYGLPFMYWNMMLKGRA